MLGEALPRLVDLEEDGVVSLAGERLGLMTQLLEERGNGRLLEVLLAVAEGLSEVDAGLLGSVDLLAVLAGCACTWGRAPWRRGRRQ